MMRRHRLRIREDFWGKMTLRLRQEGGNWGRPGGRAGKVLQAEEALCAETIRAEGSGYVLSLELRLLWLGPAREK